MAFVLENAKRRRLVLAFIILLVVAAAIAGHDGRGRGRRGGQPPRKKLDESRRGDLGSSWDRREVARGPSGQIRALFGSWDLLGATLGSP